LAGLRITKRLIDALDVTGREYFVWDDGITGFGIRVRLTGAKTYVVQYRAGSGRTAPSKRLTLGSTSKLSPDDARIEARKAIGAIARGEDPAGQKTTERQRKTVAEVATKFLSEHVAAKRKPGTKGLYEYQLTNLILPELGTKKITAVTRSDVARLHRKIGETRAPPVEAARFRASGRLCLGLFFCPRGTDRSRCSVRLCPDRPIGAPLSY
jgi:hypothetical protein